MVRTGLERALGSRLRDAMSVAAGGRLTALLTGTFLAAFMQSSTAVITMTAGFVGRKAMSVVAGLGLVLGADIGTALAAQFLNLDIASYSPLLILAGVIVFLFSSKRVFRATGRTTLGLGLIFLALSLISATTEPLRESSGTQFLFSMMADDRPLTILFGAVLTAVAQSSLAIVLLTAKLVSDGAVSLSVGLSLVLGASLAASIPSILATLGEPIEGRRVVIGNLVFRIIAVLIVVPFVSVAESKLVDSGLEAGSSVLVAYLVFNVLLALAFLPLLNPVSAFLESLMPGRPSRAETAPHRPIYLAKDDLIRTDRALANAVRETMRMAETVHEMLRETLPAFSDSDKIAAISKQDDLVDALHREATLYVAELTRQPLSETESQRAMAIFAFSTNLEHIGDIIDHNLLDTAANYLHEELEFSEEGWQELRQLHSSLVANYRLALDVFATQEEELAEDLLAEKRRFRDRIHVSIEKHLARLREGVKTTRQTSAMHLDILRDFRRVNSHLSAIAYSVLEVSSQTGDN